MAMEQADAAGQERDRVTGVQADGAAGETHVVRLKRPATRLFLRRTWMTQVVPVVQVQPRPLDWVV